MTGQVIGSDDAIKRLVLGRSRPASGGVGDDDHMLEVPVDRIKDMQQGFVDDDHPILGIGGDVARARPGADAG